MSERWTDMDDDGLTRLTVNLIPASVEALDRAAELTADTQTDTVNRALQVYSAIIYGHAAGVEGLWWKHTTGDRVQVIFGRPPEPFGWLDVLKYSLVLAIGTAAVLGWVFAFSGMR